jgi:glyoxylase-like metal-dependent hydrolase (beta-lactamase superfamily II)
MKEVAPGIHMVLTEEVGQNVSNSYLVVGSEGAAWVDTGWPRPGEGEARSEYWKSIGSPALKAIIFTHRHPPCWGNAVEIANACGNPPIIAARAELEGIEQRSQGSVKVDRPVDDGESLSLGDKTLQFVSAPGHTGGLMAVYIQESKSLFPGDGIMGIGTSVINTNEGGEVVTYLATLEKLLKISPAVIYPGQGPVIMDPPAKLNELVQHRHEREQEVIRGLQSGRNTVQALFEVIYPEIPNERGGLARNQITSQLVKLIKDGRVVQEGEIYSLV